MWKILRHYRLSKKFVKMIEKIYEGFKCNVICSNKISPAFEIITGVKQGCLLSTLLFLLILDWVLRKTADQNPYRIQWDPK